MQVHIDTPYLTVEEYARRSGLSVRAVQLMCCPSKDKDGNQQAPKLPLKPKSVAGEKTFINNALLTKQALEQRY